MQPGVLARGHLWTCPNRQNWRPRTSIARTAAYLPPTHPHPLPLLLICPPPPACYRRCGSPASPGGSRFSTGAGRTAPRDSKRQWRARAGARGGRAGERSRTGRKEEEATHLRGRRERRRGAGAASEGPVPTPDAPAATWFDGEVSVGGLQPGCTAHALLRSTFFQLFFFFCQRPAVPG